MSLIKRQASLVPYEQFKKKSQFNWLLFCLSFNYVAIWASGNLIEWFVQSLSSSFFKATEKAQEIGSMMIGPSY